MYAWRSEYQNLANQIMRDPVVFIARDGDSAFTEEVKISERSWALVGCPQQGVRLGSSAGKVYATWADTTDGTYKVWFAESTDGSVWTTEEAIAPSLGAHNSPNVAGNDAGAVWVVLLEGNVQHLVHRPVGAASFDAPTVLRTPDGSDVRDPILASNAGHTALVAQAVDTEALWLYRP